MDSEDQALPEQGPAQVEGDAIAGGEAEGGATSDGEPSEPANGAALPSPEPSPQGDASSTGLDSAAVEELLSEGEPLYRRVCAACHGASGQGAQGPAFAGNEALADADYVARTIIHGFGYMPPFGGRLDDRQIAAIATYIRESWGNSLGAVQPAEVAAQR
jgi:mono/diheme cytochrome c family protein